MDNERENSAPSFFGGIRAMIRQEGERRKSERGALITDVIVFLVAFFFARRHIAFGAYPLATALVAVLPSRVVIALIGAVTGALTLGKSGVIHAIISLIIFFLRIIISGSHSPSDNETVFSEPLIMRLSAATIGAFVGAGYEMLLSGFSLSSVLFGVFAVLLTLIAGILYSGLFFSDITVSDVLYGTRAIFERREGRDRLGAVFFEISFLGIVLLISYALSDYVYFGISLSYVFVIALTLFISKRFGVIRGMAVGFVGSVLISPSYSTAFSLIGVSAGLLFGYGAGYAMIASGIIFVLWGSYVDGMLGFLSLFPEYLIGAAIAFPLLRKAPTERREEIRESVHKRAEDMVGAGWLADMQRSGPIELLEVSLAEASARIREFCATDAEESFDEYVELVKKGVSSLTPPPCDEIVFKIATRLYKKQRLDEEFINNYLDDDRISTVIDKIIGFVAEYERALYERRRVEALALEYGLISKMINESGVALQRERAYDDLLTDKVRECFSRCGFPDGEIKVFGDRKKRIIAAGLDPSGAHISSEKLKTELERAMGIRLGSYEYYRKGDMALLKCAAAPSYSVSYAVASAVSQGSDVSGDSVKTFSSDVAFFSLLSDGMGSGAEARECAEFCTGYLSELLVSEVGVGTAISALNHIMRHRSRECTAGLDLFRFDLISSDAVFIKSGAAPSFIKREKSVFRISSETCPIGLSRSVDAERIRVEVKIGDMIVMMSDGISSTIEDSAWLITYLSEKLPKTPQEAADGIIAMAKEKSLYRDDMTVVVLRVEGV